MYESELKAIKKSNRYREREIFDESLIDLASNDYLGFAEDRELFEKAYQRVLKFQIHAPKASQLVNGYHPIHKEFEEYLCSINGFEAGIIVGSGFLANLSMIEAMVRKNDILILDELYHASGILASKLVDAKVLFFKHNDLEDLKNILNSHKFNRAIVCVEGIYSMEGDILNREVFDVCDRKDTLLIVDEAHSSGVLGDNLLGVYDEFKINIKSNHIKMGTLGKAYGSYGAFILADGKIIDFLQNRAKAIIYATAPSVFDTSLAMEGVIKTQNDKEVIREKIKDIKSIINNVFDITMDGMILKIDIKDSKKALCLKEFAKKSGFLIGAIRPPTVKEAIIRLIPRINTDITVLKSFLLELKDEI
jgi:8-amino-7-oxononanoate synthase